MLLLEVSVVIILVCNWIRSGETRKIIWDRHEILDREGKYHLYWSVTNHTVTFQLDVKTRGLVGFGLSPDGRIANSDVVIGWVSKGKSVFYDYQADNSGKFCVDKHQDWKLLFATEEKHHTILRFKRELDTCDSKDLPITVGTQRILYSFLPKDPKFGNVPHNKMRWKIRSLRLLQPQIYTTDRPKDVYRWDIRMNKVSFPVDKPTSYHCRAVKIPLKKKHHIIKITPYLDRRNRKYVKELMLRICVKEQGERGEYNTLKCPPSHIINNIGCTVIYVGAGTDQGSFIYPNHIGQPIGGDKPEYLLLQVSYYNPLHQKGIVDDSGFALYHTEHLRQFDSANLLIGTTSAMSISRSKLQFVIPGHASAQCLSKGIPKKGIKVSAVWLLAPSSAQKIKVRHFRKHKELPPITLDGNYNPQNQKYVYLERDKLIKQYDQLTVECWYEPMKRSSAKSKGGYEPSGEGCFAILTYHSPMIISQSYSSIPAELQTSLAGSNLKSIVPKGSDIYRKDKKTNMSHKWLNQPKCTVQNKIRFSRHKAQCVTINGTYIKVPYATYPDPLAPYIPQDKCTKRTSEKSSGFDEICGYF